mmetsp:Transcript_41238/g.81379  ORF Transcript_41238/g.81379 Transcript_41238/m.81379 type:complete len:868 (-) Transcript_41238:31-2634(-)
MARAAMMLLPHALLVLCCAADAPSTSEGSVRVAAETTFGAQIADLMWLGQNKTTVLILTHDGQVHRSTNGGENWTDIKSQLEKLVPPDHKRLRVSAAIRMILKSPACPFTVFAQGASRNNFASSDAGLTWTRFSVNSKIQGFQFHTGKPKWALISYWEDACRLPTKSTPCSHSLYVTKDLGNTFALVCSHVVQFSWGASAFGQSDRVYFTRFVDRTKSQPMLTRWREDLEFATTDNFGKDVKRRVAGGNKFQLSNRYILVVKVLDAARQMVKLMVSSDGGARFDPARLPHRLRQHGFALLDASEGALVVHVTKGTTIGDVYISDNTGVNFTLSLSGNIRHGGLCAFEKVMNLHGIYIANVDGNHNDKPNVNPSDKPKSPETEQNAVGASTGAQVDQTFSYHTRRLDSPKNVDVMDASWPASARFDIASEGVAGEEQRARSLSRTLRRSARRLAGEGPGRTPSTQTVVSFDNGGQWSYLKPPKRDSQGKPIKCSSDKCWLHLHDITEIPTFSPVYSYRNAVGIIMGSGNVGPFLSSKREDTNTYLSRDGGLTWIESHKGTFIYEFGNHGGLLVMADTVHETRETVFSWDEGLRWSSFEFSKNPMRVENVIIEPDAASTKFLVYGTRAGKGILRLLDFSGVHKRLCQGLGNAGTDGSDYERWTVPCILGRKVVYTRRKQKSRCFNNETIERPTDHATCPCKPSSYECEVGFSRSVGNEECKLESPKALQHQADMQCSRGAREYHADAYRRVPGDVCKGGWQPQQVPVACPPPKQPAKDPNLGTDEQIGLMPLMKVAIMFIVVAVGLWCARSNAALHLIKRWFSHASPTPAGARGRPATIGASASSEMARLASGRDERQASGYQPPSLEI